MPALNDGVGVHVIRGDERQAGVVDDRVIALVGFPAAVMSKLTWNGTPKRRTALASMLGSLGSASTAMAFCCWAPAGAGPPSGQSAMARVMRATTRGTTPIGVGEFPWRTSWQGKQRGRPRAVGLRGTISVPCVVK